MLFDANEQQDLDAFSNRHFALPDIILALMCVRWPLTIDSRPWKLNGLPGGDTA